MTSSDSPKQSRSRKEEVIRIIDKRECATVSLAEAAQVLGMHRTTAWELWRRGEFPIRVLDLGTKRHRITKMDLAGYLVGDEDFPSDPASNEWKRTEQ